MEELTLQLNRQGRQERREERGEFSFLGALGALGGSTQFYAAPAGGGGGRASVGGVAVFITTMVPAVMSPTRCRSGDSTDISGTKINTRSTMRMMLRTRTWL